MNCKKGEHEESCNHGSTNKKKHEGGEDGTREPARRLVEVATHEERGYEGGVQYRKQ